MEQDIRWKQRFSNFRRAFVLLREVTENRAVDDLSPLELEGAVQRFEYTFELLWNTLGDFLENQGFAAEIRSPRAVIKKCASSGLFDAMAADGDVFIMMIYTRNEMSHNYNYTKFRQAYEDIYNKYTHEIQRVYEYLLGKLVDE